MSSLRRWLIPLALLPVLAGAGWLWFEGSGSAPQLPPPGADCPRLELAGASEPGVLQLPAEDQLTRLNRDVRVTGELTVTYNHHLGRYGQLTLAAGGRMHHPNNGSCTTPFDHGPRFIVIDDGSREQNPEPVPFLEEQPTIRSGSTVTDLAGWFTEEPVYMADSGFADWFVLQPERLTVQPAARPLVAPDPGGSLQVAGFNVENYFTTLGSRGARNSRELERQHTKLVAALAGLNAQLIGLAEVENDEGETLRHLLNSRDGLTAVTGQQWQWLQGEGFGRGSDDIGLAFIYRSDLLAPVGPTLSDTHPVHERPPLLQRFRELATGFEFTVVMTHLKSRGGCASFDRDTGSGCWNERRDSQVRQLLTFLSQHDAQRGSGLLLLGDLNAYALEEPVQRLISAGFTDLLAEHVPATERYTYIWQPGVAGYIDHALADSELLEYVCGADIWHINADEPTVLSWSAARFGPDLYSPDPFRSSDHDPVLVGLDPSGKC